MRSEYDIRVPARLGSEPAGLTRRQLLVVALLTCGPLPLLSLGAALVSLPALVERATTNLIPFATIPLDADARVVGPRVETDLVEPTSRTVARRSQQRSIARTARAQMTARPPSSTTRPAPSTSQENVDAPPPPEPPATTLDADAPESAGPGVPPPATPPSPNPPPVTAPPPPPIPVPPPTAPVPEPAVGAGH